MEAESRIEAVTLYARGARVRRVATISLAQGAPRVRIIGLPAAVIDDTVRVEADGGAVVTAVHVGLDAPATAAAADEVTPEVRAARQRVALAAAELERLEAALAILAAAPIAVAAETDEPPPPWRAMVEARRTLVTMRAERELALRDQLAAARRALEAARRGLAAATDRDHRAGSARTARLHELRKHVELELVANGAASATLHLEYQVAAARWAPSYVARIDGEGVMFELRASVAQDTGEDWTGVAVRLSTAEPERFGALPELASQRIGRRQADPARAGFRAPPTGAAALYLDYERAFPGAARETALDLVARDEASARIGAQDAFQEEVWDEETSRAKQAFAPQSFGGAPRGKGAPPPMAQAMPAPGGPPMPAKTMMAAASYAAAPDAAKSASKPRSVYAQLGGGPPPAEPPAAPPGPPPARLDYANLRMAPPGSPRRGTLTGAPRDPRSASLDGEVGTRIARVQALVLPGGCAADWPHTYDYAFETDGAVDVSADGAWHSIAVATRPSTATLRHVAVPREQADVFRLAAVTNPLAGPLLPGPIDVYDRGSFLVTSTVEHTPPGATVEIGLGVDAQVKLSRNTEFREETTGMLRGGLRLHHAIKIDIDNLSDRAIDLEVRERLPVAREGDDDVEVIAGKVEPAWERWTPDPEAPRDRRLRGGQRWRLAVPAGQKRALRAAYEVKIAGKLELVGGNRRES
jgi:uncharacterized protein DUF4139/uncharacterized protein DUF4140